MGDLYYDRMNNLIPLYNTDQALWNDMVKQFRQQADGGPVLKILEGHVWGVPRLGNVARFETNEEAKTVFLAAGFKYVETSKGYRVTPDRLKCTVEASSATKFNLLVFVKTRPFIAVAFVRNQVLTSVGL